MVDRFKPATLPVSHRRGITFAVDDVAPSTDPLWLGTLQESLEIRSNASILFMPDADSPALAAEGYGRNTEGISRPLRVYERRFSDEESAVLAKERAIGLDIIHPLVQAVHLAFSDHRPLVLSPDAIWLTIVQSFGQHVHENAEALRNRLVKHEGKKTLTVKTNFLSPEEWPRFISLFSTQIRDNSDPVLHETLLCEFSTTTPTIRTAGEVALMDTYQRYFKYEVLCICGIPKITLEGTNDDWQRIRDRIEVLATYGLDWWTSRLGPILDEFMATANGKPNREFWKAIYKPEAAYGAELASGWITDLFPYLNGGTSDFEGGDEEVPFYARHGSIVSLRYRPNPMLNVRRVNWVPVTKKPRTGIWDAEGVSLSSFPSGLSRVPVKVKFPDNSEKEIELMGGFFGISQGEEDNALSPIIGWAGVTQSQDEAAQRRPTLRNRLDG